jgi:DNA-binding FadR family transcriptional regulator
MLGALTDVVAEVLAGRTHHHLMPERPEPKAIRWHAEVVQAVQSADAAAAERTMRDIVDEATRAMLGEPR